MIDSGAPLTTIVHEQGSPFEFMTESSLYGFPWYGRHHGVIPVDAQSRWRAIFLDLSPVPVLGDAFGHLIPQLNKTSPSDIQSLLAEIGASLTVKETLVSLNRLINEKLASNPSNSSSVKKRRRIETSRLQVPEEIVTVDLCTGIGSLDPEARRAIYLAADDTHWELMSFLALSELFQDSSQSHERAINFPASAFNSPFWLEQMEERILKRLASTKYPLEGEIGSVFGFLSGIGFRSEYIPGFIRQMLEFTLSTELDEDVRIRFASCISAIVQNSPEHFTSLSRIVRGMIDATENHSIPVLQPILLSLWTTIVNDCHHLGHYANFDEWCILTKKYLVSGSLAMVKIGTISALGSILAMTNFEDNSMDGEGCSQYGGRSKNPCLPNTLRVQLETMQKCMLNNLETKVSSVVVLSDLLCHLKRTDQLRDGLDFSFLSGFCVSSLRDSLLNASKTAALKYLDSIVRIALLIAPASKIDMMPFALAESQFTETLDSVELVSQVLKSKHLLLNQLYRADSGDLFSNQLEYLDRCRNQIIQMMARKGAKATSPAMEIQIRQSDEGLVKFLSKLAVSSTPSRVQAPLSPRSPEQDGAALSFLAGHLDVKSTLFFLCKPMPWTSERFKIGWPALSHLLYCAGHCQNECFDVGLDDCLIRLLSDVFNHRDSDPAAPIMLYRLLKLISIHDDKRALEKTMSMSSLLRSFPMQPIDTYDAFQLGYQILCMKKKVGIAVNPAVVPLVEYLLQDCDERPTKAQLEDLNRVVQLYSNLDSAIDSLPLIDPELISHTMGLHLLSSFIRSTEITVNGLDACIQKFVERVAACKDTSNFAPIIVDGRDFIEAIIDCAIPFFEKGFKRHASNIIAQIKTLQTATRSIQSICGGIKEMNVRDVEVAKSRVKLFKAVAPMKHLLERLLAEIKNLLSRNDCIGAFWLGNLKNRTLDGDDVMASQIPISM